MVHECLEHSCAEQDHKDRTLIRSGGVELCSKNP